MNCTPLDTYPSPKLLAWRAYILLPYFEIRLLSGPFASGQCTTCTPADYISSINSVVMQNSMKGVEWSDKIILI